MMPGGATRESMDPDTHRIWAMNRHLRAAVDQVDEGVLILELEPTTADGPRIVFVNRGIAEMTAALPHTGGTEVAVIESGVPGVWVSEARTARSGDTVVAVSDMMHSTGGAFAVDRSNVRITILGANYAVDVQGCTAG